MYNENKYRLLLRFLFLMLILSYSTKDITAQIEQTSKPKNIILFISDGCGFNHVDAASYYQYGKTGEQIYEKFPVKLAVSTFAADSPVYNPDSSWSNFSWVRTKPTDSAASGTAIASGYKTYFGTLSVDTLGQPIKTIVEKYEDQGKSTGVISTVPFSNATPACFAAHNVDRQNYLDIAKEMIMESGVDVIIGGGHPFYDPNGTLVDDIAERYFGEKEIWDMNNGGKPISNEDGKLVAESQYRYVGGKEVWDLLSAGKAGSDADGDGENDPWSFIQDRESFQQYITGDTPDRLIGIYKSGQAAQVERSGVDGESQPFDSPFIETIPTLKEMTLAAINVLDENQNGFFLMAEGGAVDWAAHGHILNRTIEEQIDFNIAVEAACEWVTKNSSWDETLIIVTADHETAYLTGPNSDSEEAETISEKWKPIVNNGKDKMPDVEWHSQGHTNSLVPFYAKGPGSDLFLNRIHGTDPVYGKYIDNTDIGRILGSF